VVKKGFRAMRLSVSSDQIKAVLQQHFGAETRVWLFGLRVDDHARGGDIDLYIEPRIEDPDPVGSVVLTPRMWRKL